MNSMSYLSSIGYDSSVIQDLDLNDDSYRIIRELSELFPLDKFRIIISHSHSHIKKTIILSYLILEKLTNSSILRVDSFEISDFVYRTDFRSLKINNVVLVIVDNFSSNLIDVKGFISLINEMIKIKIPILISTPLSLDQLDNLDSTIHSIIYTYVLKGI